MDNPLTTPAGNLVVQDGPARAVWSRGPAAQARLTGIWPGADQRKAVAAHMRDGGAMLVLIEAAPCTVVAMRDEVEWAPDAEQSEIVEITIPTLDWLPVRMRRAGERFRRQALLGLLDIPVLQRPGLMLSSWVPRTRLRFALRSPGVRADVTETALSAYADAVLSTDASRWWAARPVSMPDARGSRALLG